MPEKFIFITGAAGGMGLATAERFAQAGWFVGMFDLDEARVREAAGRLPPDQVLAGRVDVTSEASVAGAAAAFAARTGERCDVLFNNAGIAPGGWFDEMDTDTIRRIIDINLMGVIYGTRALLPLLRQTPDSLSVSTSSSVAMFGHAMRAVYSASKAGVKALTEALSLEFERFGIRTADILPGCIDTPMLRSALAAGAGGTFSEQLFERLPKTGPYRLMPVSAIAETVWRAYHDRDRLHWYVPDDLEAIDRMDTPEARRETRAFLFGD